MAAEAKQSEEQRRPYAAAANVVAVLNRIRTRNLPVAVDSEFYRLAGVGEAVHGRVTAALSFLGLIDEGGAPTDTLRAMAQATEAEFKELLAASIREAYADDFQKIDPAQDTQGQIIDAFRRYEPRSQTARMVMLFLGLAREASIPVKDVPRDRKMASPARSAKATRPAARPARSGASGTPPPPAPSSPPAGAPGLLFGVTVEDIAALDEKDFATVWAALGKVARARAKPAPTASAPAEAPDAAAEADADDDDEGGDEV